MSGEVEREPYVLRFQMGVLIVIADRQVAALRYDIGVIGGVGERAGGVLHIPARQHRRNRLGKLHAAAPSAPLVSDDAVSAFAIKSNGEPQPFQTVIAALSDSRRTEPTTLLRAVEHINTRHLSQNHLAHDPDACCAIRAKTFAIREQVSIVDVDLLLPAGAVNGVGV